jgi:phosphate transport system protein
VLPRVAKQPERGSIASSHEKALTSAGREVLAHANIVAHVAIREEGFLWDPNCGRSGGVDSCANARSRLRPPPGSPRLGSWIAVAMDLTPSEWDPVEAKMMQLFALVSEALAGATDALLGIDTSKGSAVVEGDQAVDELTAEVELMVWGQIDDDSTPASALRHLVGTLLILPELERSGDLAEHIAQRAVANLGAEMSPLSRGIVQRMADVALGMWRDAADAYGDRSARSLELHEDDEEIDILHDRLTKEIAAETMPTAVGAQVTLLARFYERLGDHAVNLARRVEMLHKGE